MRGIGVAVITSVCGASPAALRASAARWRTPKRCCSSITTSARRRNADALLDQRVRADHQVDLAGRELRPDRVRRRARDGGGEQRDAQGSARPAGSARRRSVRSCCSASSSVGAISAVWQPASATAIAASSATTVLPLPTSPCSRRCIGCGRARSARSSSQTRCCARVSRNGRPADGRARPAAVSRDRDRRIARPALAPQREAELEQVELLEHQPRVGGAGAGAQRRQVAVERRLMQLAQRLRGLRQRELADQRGRQVARQQIGVLLDGVLDGAAQRARMDALGRGVVRRDAAQLGALGAAGSAAPRRCRAPRSPDAPAASRTGSASRRR